MQANEAQQKLNDLLGRIHSRIPEDDLFRRQKFSAKMAGTALSEGETVTVVNRDNVFQIRVRPIIKRDWLSPAALQFASAAETFCKERERGSAFRSAVNGPEDRIEIDLPEDKADEFFAAVEVNLQ